jgi:hypothetical protein
VDDELWDRVRGLAGALLALSGGRSVRVVAVSEHTVVLRAAARPGTNRLTRRMLAEALPFVAAGQPLPPKLRTHAARLTAILHAIDAGDCARR